MAIENKTLSERAYDEIRQGLVQGIFQPGQALVIRTLAAHYGISITPVRDALQRLVAEGLLTMLPNRSIAVPYLSDSLLFELVRIRSELEGLAAELATPNIRAADGVKLEKILSRLKDAAAKREGKRYVTVNREFHFAIYERAQSPLLLQMIADLWTKIGPSINRLFDDAEYVDVANDEHEIILASLLSGNAAEARRHISLDIQSAATSMRSRLGSVDVAEPRAAPQIHIESTH